MDAVASSPPVLPAVPVSAAKRAAVLLDALRLAARGGEHRLFQSGKLAGLFPARAGIAAEVALDALADGVLETVRTEARGKLVTEWVRATPKGVRRLHDTDSPLAAVRELLAAVADAREELGTARDRLDALGERLESLTGRLDAALRRADLSALGERTAWAGSALRFLDCRPGAACPLGELFRAVGDDHPGLTLADFHAGLVRLADARAVRLLAEPAGDPEFAVLHGPAACHAAIR